MKAYHISETLKPGDILETDHQRLKVFAQPFVQALEHSENCYFGMILNSKYLHAVLSKSGMREWSDYAKWATEGAFEFIRKTEFPSALSRLECCFFYDDLDYVKRLYKYDWADEPEEIQNSIHLFEVELNDGISQKYDMNFYDRAYNSMEKSQDTQTVFDCARRYYSGEHTERPVWEILSDKKIKVIRDVTALLR